MSRLSDELGMDQKVLEAGLIVSVCAILVVAFLVIASVGGCL